MDIQFKEVGPEFDASTVDAYLPFTQSTPYFLWNINYGREGYRFVGTKNGQDIFFVQFFVYTIYKIKILYAPLGPIATSPLNEEEMDDFIAFLLSVTRGGNYSFVKMHLADGVSGLKKTPGYASLSSSFVQPRYDRVIPLEETLVLPYGARREIKKAEKEVSLEISDINENAINDFLKLMTETEQRKSLTQHNEKYYRALFNLPPEHRECLELLFATYNSKRVAMALVATSGKRASYLFGGATREGIQKQAQYFLQWSAMQRGIQSGIKYYSLGGTLESIDGRKNKRSSMYGVSMFKKKFGGFIKNYGDPYDLVINMIHYGLYTMYKFLKR